MRKQINQHWFLFSYRGDQLVSGLDCYASTYTGYPNKDITMKRIQENKKNAGVDDGAVVISISYLGYMTRDDFIDDVEIKTEQLKESE